MRDDLLLYYERELTYLRQSGALFAEKYPKIASRLQLEPDKCEDPHVERLLEAFAFLSARVHLKIDDEFPEITESILGIVYPHLVRPVPSMSIVQFQFDPEQGKLTSAFNIPKGAVLYSKAKVDGVPCNFRTCYDTSIWPIWIPNADWRTPDRLKPPVKAQDAAHVVRIELQCPPDTPFAKLELDKLRFYLSGESAVVNALYEVLCVNLTGVQIRDLSNPRNPPIVLPPSVLTPVGFEPNEGVLEYDRRSFLGYRLLQEFFTLPEKFFFFDLTGLERIASFGDSSSVEVLLLLSRFEGEQRRQRLEANVTAKSFRLGCTPIINLFPQTAEPILLDQQKFEYRVVPDVRRPLATEIYSIDDVASLNQQEVTRFHPFYAFRQRSEGHKHNALWIANRRPSNRVNDPGTEIDISLVDLTMRPMRPNVDTLNVRTTCTNRDLPARLPFGQESDFELDGGSPFRSIISLIKPTTPYRPALGKAIQWRLISHLSLNYLSLVEEGREALQEILRIYDFTDSAFTSKVISGILNVSSASHFARVVSENGISFVRGTRIELELDEEQFVGAGAYLFASVLERFLGTYTSINSFTQLLARSRQRKEPLRQWLPRAGRKILT